jgi:hypothetical protein
LFLAAAAAKPHRDYRLDGIDVFGAEVEPRRRRTNGPSGWRRFFLGGALARAEAHPVD